MDGKKKRSNADKSRAGRIKPVCGTDGVYNII